MASEAIDLGSGHSFVWTVADAERWNDPWEAHVRAEEPGFPRALCYQLEDDGKLLLVCGIIESHIGADGKPCASAMQFTRPKNPSKIEQSRPTWEVHSLEPLHTEPSIQCRREGCNTHGYIRGGRWEDT